MLKWYSLRWEKWSVLLWLYTNGLKNAAEADAVSDVKPTLSLRHGRLN